MKLKLVSKMLTQEKGSPSKESTQIGHRSLNRSHSLKNGAQQIYNLRTFVIAAVRPLVAAVAVRVVLLVLLAHVGHWTEREEQ